MTINYQRITWIGTEGEAILLSMCLTCFAVVGDQARHTTWHEGTTP